MNHYADRLAVAVQSRGNAGCVGLDPRWEKLPADTRARHDGTTFEGISAGYVEFCSRIIEIVTPIVGVVKFQSAFFEACGASGVAALRHLIELAHTAGLFVILDAKRNDIADTATAYAQAAFHVLRADAVTVNPYLGREGVEPFLVMGRAASCGTFVLVRTSNAGAGQFQDLRCDGQPVYEHVGQAVASWGDESLGECGLGDVGAVVGATHPAELRDLRERMPRTWFLVPGYGAQGGAAESVQSAFRGDRLGAIINSSRGVIFAFKPDDRWWEPQVESAARQLAADFPV